MGPKLRYTTTFAGNNLEGFFTTYAQFGGRIIDREIRPEGEIGFQLVILFGKR